SLDDPLEGLELERLLVDLGRLDVLQLDVRRWRGHRLHLGLAERYRLAGALARLLRSTHARRPPGSRCRVPRRPPTLEQLDEGDPLAWAEPRGDALHRRGQRQLIADHLVPDPRLEGLEH